MKQYEELDSGGRVVCKMHGILRCGECSYIEQLESENERLINSLKTCDECNGYGELIVPTPMKGQPYNVTCEECEGTGHIDSDDLIEQLESENERLKNDRAKYFNEWFMEREEIERLEFENERLRNLIGFTNNEIESVFDEMEDKESINLRNYKNHLYEQLNSHTKKALRGDNT